MQTEEVWASTVVQQTTSSTLGSKTLLKRVDGSASIESGVEKTVEKSETATEEAEEAEEAGSAAASAVTDHPPPAVFEYKMVDDLFYAAKKAPRGTPASFWSYNQYRRTAEDGSLDKVKVHYCRSTHTMERVCKEHFMNEKVLGFDLEWMADSTRWDGLKKNVSLIQLASPSRIGLFHVALFPDTKDMVGPSFRSIMENPDVMKVGVSIKGDTTRLRRCLDVHSRGLIELSNLYKLVVHSRNQEYHKINRRLVPLAVQVEEFLHLPLFKGQDVRSSDWSKALNMDQVLYSASDAYAGVQLYATLDHHRKQLDPCPPHPHFAESNLAIQIAEGVKATIPDDSVEADDDVLANEETTGSLILNVVIDGELYTVPPLPKETKKKARQAKKSAPTTPPTAKPLEQPKDSRLEISEDRVAAYRASHPNTRATVAQLRSYYLWHCYDLPPFIIAQLVRRPPLKTATVVQYILSVVQSDENLPVDMNQLREVAKLIPSKALWARFPRIFVRIAQADKWESKLADNYTPSDPV